MDKEMLDILNDLSKKPTTELALQIMELSSENLILEQQCKKQKEVIDKVTNELFILKDMIYKPETREENFEIQRKISSIIKRLNGKEVSE